MKRTKKRIAFTLAEVLITIAIIGIVAALTIPTLIKNYKVHELQNSFTKSLAMVKEAYRLALDDYSADDISELPYDEFRDNFEPLIVQHLKIAKIHNITKHSSMHKGSTAKGTRNYTNTNSGASCFSLDSPTESRKGYILLSGQFVCFKNRGDTYNKSNSIHIDTNGYKGPNRLGYDIFSFDLTNDVIPSVASRSYSPQYCYPVLGYTYYNHANQGIYCAEYALKDKSPVDSTKSYWKSLKF